MSILDYFRRKDDEQAKSLGIPYQLLPKRYSDGLSGPEISRMLHVAAERTCWDIPRYRQSGGLNERELSLSFLGFALWYIGCLNAHANGDDSPLNYPSDPARFEAMRVMACAADQESVRAELQRTLQFNPATELRWAAEKTSNSVWKECLTRAVIMGCRSMAYSVATASGFNAIPADKTDDGLALGRAIENVPPNAVIFAASAWLNKALGTGVSRQLLSLENIRGEAPEPLQYV
jgi:hypothetical protein